MGSIQSNLRLTAGEQVAKPAQPPARPSVSATAAGVGQPPGAAAADSFTGPHAVVRRGKAVIDGKETLLYGGDLHYFRVRSKRGDVEKTHQKWAETMDKMVEAGMNLVTTYVPWDYHNPAPGRYDFTGVRDLRKFMDLAAERGLKVVLKPGPCVMGEWPRGFGSYGSAPGWWKQANPGSLEVTASGKQFSFSLFGDPRERQPAYLDPEYLAAVDGWYAAFAEQIRPYVGKGLIGIQLDNETNIYWGDRFSGPGHSPSGLAFYRERLREQYQTIDALNRAYGTEYADFEQVEPPVEAPSPSAAPGPGDVAARDWFEAGHAYSLEYLRRLRGKLEDRGLKTPDVIFSTNDSPFTLAFGGRVLKNLLLPDGRKREVSVPGVDLYPKTDFDCRTPQTQPFQADFYTRLFGAFASTPGAPAAGEPSGFASSPELQAGMFPILGPIRMPVPPEATDQLLARTIGRGLRMGSLYVIRDGLNADNSRYDYQAPIDRKGATTARYEVVKRWGGFLKRCGDDLLQAKEVTNRIALLVDPELGVPKAGMQGRPAELAMSEDNPALFGLMASAGLDPEVIDLREVEPEDLDRFKLLVALRPDRLSAASQAKIAAARAPALSFGPDEAGAASTGAAPRTTLSPSALSGLNSPRYYRMSDQELVARSARLLEVAAAAGERPLVSVAEPHALAWAARSASSRYLFVINDAGTARTLTVRLHHAGALALDPAGHYKVREGLSDRSLGELTGQALLDHGVELELARYSTAVVVVRPIEGAAT